LGICASFIFSSDVHAQVRADHLRSANFFNSGSEEASGTPPASAPGCVASLHPLSPALRESHSSTVDKLSARLSPTAIFVELQPTPPSKDCVDANTHPGSPRLGLLVSADFCAFGGFQAVTSVAPANLSPICLPEGIVFARSWDILKSPADSLKVVGNTLPHEGFHWKPALRESVEFLLFEHGFRLVDDPYLRYLLFHKPFWHDWLVSANQFDGTRWGDGDDFLVNYVGHPMQGGVTGDIYLQNDPRARGLKFGRSSEYWKSRLRAMAWSAVYSAYFEIGPVLSEAAIGNEGGYTYTPGCGHYVCNRPGYKPPTNNTAWVDFVVTPTVGTGLIVLEDFIELKVVDPLAKDSPAFKYKVLRSVLNPTQSMANMMAPRYPWSRRYTDETFQPAEFGGAVNPAMQTRTESWKYEPRWTAGFHYTNTDIPMDWPGCSACRVHSSGVGTNVGYRLTNLIYFDSEANVFPGSSSSNGKGRAEEFLAGVKMGRTFGSWGMFVTARPGFIHYQQTLVPASQTNYESAFRTALDAGGTVEYHVSARSTIRFDVGTTLVRYLTGHPDPRQLPDTVLSDDYIVTQGNFHLGSGYVFRF
jgi:hypothetical protein